jgi:hypothetical protein
MILPIRSRNRPANAAKINGDDMENKEITEEQKKKFKKLQIKFALRMALQGVKYGSLLFAATSIVCAIDVFYVQNQTFAFIGSMISTIFIFRSFRLSLAREHDRVREEVKKILEN